MQNKPINLNWSFSSLGCPQASLDEMIHLALLYNIKGIEARCVSDRTDLPTLFRELYPDLSVLTDSLQKNNLSLVSLDSSSKMIGNFEAAKVEIPAFAQLAHDLSVPSIRIFDGGTFNETLSQSNKQEALDFIKWWNDLKAQHGWTVNAIIETHDALCTANVILDLNESSETPLPILWDAHHTWKKGNEAIFKTWPAIKHLVHHVHFKDSISVPSARHPMTYVNLGDGEFNLTELFTMLKTDSFTGPVSLEWEKQWHPYLEPIEVALKSLQKFR